MKLYIKDMTKEQLNEWAALAQGWTLTPYNETSWYIRDAAGVVFATVGKIDACNKYDPIHNSQQAMDLIVALKIDINHNTVRELDNEPDYIGAKCINNNWSYGSTPNMAIVRAVIASVYGEYVEVDNA